MAISHLGRSVLIYKQDGSFLELSCSSERRATELAHELIEYVCEQYMKLQEEEETNGLVPKDSRISYKVRP